MKNIQIIDGAVNSAYSVYAIPDEAFLELFPEPGQDIEFLEDAIARCGEERISEVMRLTWNSRLSKAELSGIHGTLFIGLIRKKPFYPNKRESDLDNPNIQRAIKGIS